MPDERSEEGVRWLLKCFGELEPGYRELTDVSITQPTSRADVSSDAVSGSQHPNTTQSHLQGATR